MRAFSRVRLLNDDLATHDSGKGIYMSEQPRTDTDRLEQPQQNTEVTPEHHDEDVSLVVEEHNGDGPGDEDPGKSDFQGFAEDDVQEEDPK
jgi:hypothetical protein